MQMTLTETLICSYSPKGVVYVSDDGEDVQNMLQRITCIYNKFLYVTRLIISKQLYGTRFAHPWQSLLMLMQTEPGCTFSVSGSSVGSVAWRDGCLWHVGTPIASLCVCCIDAFPISMGFSRKYPWRYLNWSEIFNVCRAMTTHVAATWHYSCLNHRG